VRRDGRRGECAGFSLADILAIAVSMSASVGLGFTANKADADMICDWQ
jgi:hypothetical protein